MRMSSSQTLLFTLCMSLSCVRRAAGLIHASGYEGRAGQVSCSYGEGYESYEKYLCRNDCGSNDVLVTTTEKQKNRYSIHDDKQKRVFTTTISGLMQTDAGKYWCGVTRNGKDIYTEVKLEVAEDSCCAHSTKVESYEEGSASFSCPYESEHQNSLKYICRGIQPSTCLQQAIVTSEAAQKGQFRLTDNKQSRGFTVTISSLTQGNSGSYLCGVHANTGLDVFSAFNLKVKAWCCVDSKDLRGTVGRPVTMQCPYPPQHRDNRKFLCKGEHRNNCTDMVTSQSRFTLQDDIPYSSFSVTITELKAEDAGTYWCGSDSQWSAANYVKIHLSAGFPRQTATVTSAVIPTSVFESFGSQSTHLPGNQIKAPLHPVVFAVPAVLLVLTFALVIFCKIKCHKVREAGANMNRIESKAAGTEEVIDGAEMYANQDAVFHKQVPFKPQTARQLYDDACEAEQDSVYQNFSTADDIYCNQFFTTGSRR